VGGVEETPGGYRAKLEYLIEQAHLAHADVLERVPAGVRASLPVDATGVTQAIDILAAAVGIEAELHARRDRLNRANPAVLHGRVFGRTEQLPADTVIAAFADGARVRRTLLEALAAEIDGDALAAEVGALLDAHPLPGADTPVPERVDRLRSAYAAQERAVVLCAERLDARER
jgi:hypothetical protein